MYYLERGFILSNIILSDVKTLKTMRTKLLLLLMSVECFEWSRRLEKLLFKNQNHLPENSSLQNHFSLHRHI